MKPKVCCFAGHANIYNQDKVKEKLKKEIINLIENYGVTRFYNGGKGDFDWICAHCVDELKKDYPYIKSYLVLAYIPKEKVTYSDKSLKLFDGSIYPDIEKTPPRFAISKRNEWMIDNSDFLICYVENSMGGAYNTLKYAKRKSHIVITNLAEKDKFVFPERLRLLRTQNNLSQEMLAEMLSLAHSTIGMYEQGRREPACKILLKICNVLNTTPNYILGLEEKCKPAKIEVENIFSDFIESLENSKLLTFNGSPLTKPDEEQLILSFKVALEISKKFIQVNTNLKNC